MNRIFAIGDIHGCNEAFKKMLFEKIKIEKTDDIYCIGDYIDRGPDSKGAIDTIIRLREKGYQIRTLRGNHEQMMMDSGQSKENFVHWYINGGNKTLESFNVDSYFEMQETYKSFFQNTEYFIESGDYIFVHAGLNFSKNNIFEDKEAMLWVRDFSRYQPVLQNRILIHGHTPISLKKIKSQTGNCINIDGGCVYKENRSLGNMVAIGLPGREIIAVANKK
ncbi:MAG TPA: metallophosphoesterase family protein [Hanamia sp.]|nr:metallophosphoesterase family protein [Hanamia sp.]